MSRTVILEWEGREHSYNPKSADWYWAVGIIALASIIAAILFGNYLLAIVVFVAAAAIALHGTKQPPIHRFKLVEHGLVIGGEFYPFDNMLSFAVLEDVEGELPPLLSIRNDSWLSPHLHIPLEGIDADTVYDYFLDRVEEGGHQHSFSDLVAAWLGF